MISAALLRHIIFDLTDVRLLTWKGFLKLKNEFNRMASDITLNTSQPLSKFRPDGYPLITKALVRFGKF